MQRLYYGDDDRAELDAGVQGWINHVRYGDTWGLRRALLGRKPRVQAKTGAD